MGHSSLVGLELGLVLLCGYTMTGGCAISSLVLNTSLNMDCASNLGLSVSAVRVDSVSLKTSMQEPKKSEIYSVGNFDLKFDAKQALGARRTRE